MLSRSPTSSLSLVRARLYDTAAELLSMCLQWATKHFNLLPVEPDRNAQTEIGEKMDLAKLQIESSVDVL